MSPTEWCWSAIRCSAAGLLIVTAGLGTPMLYLFAYDSYDLRPARIFPHPRHAPAPPATAGATATDSASPSVSAAAEEERCGAAWASGGSDPIDWIQADPSSNHFVDSHGRVRLFHGLNVVFKTPPHIPDPGEWEAETSFGPADAANLSAWGFNAIRLGVLWAGTFPARRDQLDSGYIDKVQPFYARGLAATPRPRPRLRPRSGDWQHTPALSQGMHRGLPALLTTHTPPSAGPDLPPPLPLLPCRSSASSNCALLRACTSFSTCTPTSFPAASAATGCPTGP